MTSAARRAEADLDTSTLYFAEETLGLNLYDWQARALRPLEKATGRGARRQNISVCTPNESGKDSRIIPVAAYWWLSYHARGTVVITSSSDLQLAEQTIVNLDLHRGKFQWREPVYSPRYTLETPTGGRVIAFVTNSAGRVEGWHKTDDHTGPLLIILNEAKSLDNEIIDGFLARCDYNAFIMLSSPGLEGVGRHWESHTEKRAEWTCIRAGLSDCPHISKERIDQVIALYGPDSPITRSTLYGEFMKQEQEGEYCVPHNALVMCYECPAVHTKGLRHLFCDFATGGAENVACLRDGNKYTIEDAWCPKTNDYSEDTVVGRFIWLFSKLKLKPAQITGDAAAKSILDKLAQSGWAINRQNFGAPARQKEVYTSWGAEAWLEGAAKIKNREVILPVDEVLKAQVVGRKRGFTAGGKLNVEDKLLMKKRGLPSPDRADALFGALHVLDMSHLYGSTPEWQSLDDALQEQDNEKFLNSIGANCGY